MAPTELAPGTELFGHVILRTLGHGGMGTVYLAEQQSLKRQVALKLLGTQRINNPHQVEGFLREARAAGGLNHPNLLMVHGVHADPAKGLYCYSMEFVPGRTLTALVQQEGPLKREMALHLLLQVARATGFAHRAGLVHRDIKPDNILVTAGGVAKLADLGLVRDRLEGRTASSGRKLTIVGTPDFSAPEQSRNPSRAMPSSDVYSLGACLYFMLLGRPPFHGETVIDLIVRAATEEPELPETMPEDCRTLIACMLAKDPADRFVNGDAVVAALEAIAQGKPVPLPPPVGTMAAQADSAPERSGVRIRMRRRRR